VPFVLADLPANSSGDLASRLQEVATSEAIGELDLSITAVGTVTPYPGSARKRGAMDLSTWRAPHI